MKKKHTVFACAAEPAILEGLRSFLSGVPDFEYVGGASSPMAGAAAILHAPPTIVLLDHTEGIRPAVDQIMHLRRENAGLNCVLWIRDVPESSLVRALQAGAKGFVSKFSPLSVVLDCLRRVAAGEVYVGESASRALRQWTRGRALSRVTARESQIIGLIQQGLQNREIAERLSITPGTVKVHLMHIFEKTGVRNRYDLAFIESDIISDLGSEEELLREGPE